ncbi:MAG: pyruvate formate lyase family protein [Methanobrevibacter sp.]
MNRYVKNIAKVVYHKLNNTYTGKKIINLIFLFRTLNRKYKSPKIAGTYLIKNIRNVYYSNSKEPKGKQIKKLMENIKITIPNKGFIYSIDELKNLSKNGSTIDNITIDYELILNYSIKDYKKYFNNTDIINSEYINNEIELLNSIEILINREVNEIKKSNRTDKNKYIKYLENIKTDKANNFEEGLQRILFINQILWQTGHGLNGLGRLDKILNNLYYSDLEKNIISKKDAYKIIKNFIKTLHEYYWFKSSALMGDTGQIIILGGTDIDENGNEYYFYNDLTYLFIKAICELQIPDPKILLRVNEDTPRNLLQESIKTMNTGVGSPLISNDKEVISKMINFGYDSKDAYNYVVSACWEPAALGKGIEQNNINFISFLKPLNRIFDTLSNEELNKIKNFNDLISLYKKYLKEDVKEIIEFLDNITWDEDPLLSLFIDNCNKKQLDISKGGAKYNHYGITTVSLANTVNSLINLKKLVFENKKYNLVQINNIRKNNFENEKNLITELKNVNPHFGEDNEEVINLTNLIINYLSKLLNKTNKLGGKIKFGLSAPSYISAGEEINASFDGRLNYEPFSTHISSDSNNDYTSIMRFASQINYNDNRFNGNVVDLMATPNFIKDNFEKFTDFLDLSIKLGFFQMQMNVTDSKTLIDAKANPDLYPNLIVRVWGFSAYFNDLPLNYKDLLIKRALKNEGKINI